MQNEYLIYSLAYLIGSIPFGLVFSKIFGYGDIRKIGSGNIGTTNVLRTGNKFLALLTLIADGGKAVIAMLLATKCGFSAEIAGALAIIGHLFPVWLQFKGGKGFASFIGFTLYLLPKLAALILVTWLIVFLIFRYSSLAAIIAVSVGGVYLALTGGSKIIIAIILLIIFKHKDNIKRLIEGKETKFKKYTLSI